MDGNQVGGKGTSPGSRWSYWQHCYFNDLNIQLQLFSFNETYLNICSREIRVTCSAMTNKWDNVIAHDYIYSFNETYLNMCSHEIRGTCSTMTITWDKVLNAHNFIYSETINYIQLYLLGDNDDYLHCHHYSLAS